VSFASITLYVASQRVFIAVVYFVIDSVRKLLDTPKDQFSMPVNKSCVMSLPSTSLGSWNMGPIGTVLCVTDPSCERCDPSELEAESSGTTDRLRR
jgi:hypothetical protein